MLQKRPLSSLCLLPITAAFLVLAFRAETASAAAAKAISQCLTAVIPSLFPFFVLSGLLLRLGTGNGEGRAARIFEKLFHIRGAALPVFLLSLLSGYPVGAVSAASLYRRGGCSREEAERLLLFSNNCGPGFLLGLTAHMLGSSKAAFVLLMIQWSVSVWLGCLLGTGKCVNETELPDPEPPQPLFRALPQSVAAAGRNVLLVCAYVVFFAVIGAFLPETPLLRGTLELTGGILLMEGRSGVLPLAAFLVSFGGLAVSAQVLNAAEDAGLRASAYLPFRLLHGVCCCALAFLWQKDPLLLLPAALLLISSTLFANWAVQQHKNAV